MNLFLLFSCTSRILFSRVGATVFSLWGSCGTHQQADDEPLTGYTISILPIVYGNIMQYVGFLDEEYPIVSD